MTVVARPRSVQAAVVRALVDAIDGAAVAAFEDTQDTLLAVIDVAGGPPDVVAVAAALWEAGFDDVAIEPDGTARGRHGGRTFELFPDAAGLVVSVWRHEL